MKHFNSRSKNVLLCLLMTFLFALESRTQTVFVFNKSSASYDFQSPATWVNNAVPQNGDILSFVGVGFNTITNVPTINLSSVINDGEGISFESATGGTSLKIDNLTFNNEIGFNTASSYDVVLGNVWGAGGQRITYNTGINVSVTGTFVDNGLSFYNGWIASALTFTSGAIYKADFNISFLPYGTWNTGSTVSITGLTGTNQINNTNQVFYNFYIDSPLASSASTSLNEITCLGTFGIKNIGGNSIGNAGSGPDYHFNDVLLANGTLYIAYQKSLYVTGNITQTGGAFQNNNGQFILNGSTNQEVMISNPGNCDITVVNTGASGSNIISLTGNSLFNSLDITSGTVQLNAFTHTIAGSLTATSGDMMGSSLSGLVFPGNPGGTTTIPAGTATLQTLILNRQYNNSVYLGGNLTITGDLQTYDDGDLDLNGNSLVISGRMVRNSGNVNIVGASASTLIFTNGSAYVHNFDGGNIINATWMAGSTASITGVISNQPGNFEGNTLYNLVWDAPAQNASLGISPYGANGSLTIAGALIIKNTGSSNVSLSQFNGSSSNNSLYVKDFTLAGGTFVGNIDDNYGPTGNLYISGNYYQSPMAVFSVSGNTTHTNGFGLNVYFTGGNSIINGNLDILSTNGVSPNIYINKNTANANINLAGNVSIANDFTIQKGLITTGSNTLSVAGIITGASSTTGWVNGNLAKKIDVGLFVVKTFEVGSATAYAPVTLTFPGVVTPGSVAVKVSDGDDPDVGSACINQDKSINKYWSINTVAGMPVIPLLFDASFSFDQTTDVDADINPSSIQTFIYNGSNWSTSLSVPSITGNAISLNGLYTTGEYFIAETGPKISAITGPSLLCQDGMAVVYSVLGNNCSNLYTWTVSGGSLTTTGDNISIVWTSTGINQIGVASSDGTSISPISMLAVTINGGIAAATDPIAGLSSVTVSSQNTMYSVTSVPGVGYTWTVSGGGTLTSTANTSSIVWSVPGIFTLSVTPSNNCGIGLGSVITVTVVSVSGILPPVTLPGVDATSITILASSNVISVDKETLQLNVTALPVNATLSGINWSVSDTAIAKISASGLLTPVTNGVVTVTASVIDNISIQSSLAITISGQGQTGTITGIATSLGTGLSLYPNPASTSFTLDVESGAYAVDIYSLQGVSVDKRTITGTTTFNTENLSAGVYLVKVQSGNASKTFRLVITK